MYYVGVILLLLTNSVSGFVLRPLSLPQRTSRIRSSSDSLTTPVRGSTSEETEKSSPSASTEEDLDPENLPLWAQDLDYPPTEIEGNCERAADAVIRALDDGHILTEVQFPMFPPKEQASLDATTLFLRSIQLATKVAKEITQKRKVRVCVLTSNEFEFNTALGKFGPALGNPYPNVTVAPMQRTYGETQGGFDNVVGWLQSNIFNFLGDPVYMEGYDLYIFSLIETRSVKNIRFWHEQDPTKPIVFCNTDLERYRGNIGIVQDCPYEMHYEFLCRVMPVYNVISQQFVETIKNRLSPFFYQGIFYKNYPRGWQTFIDLGDDRIRRVDVGKDKPNFLDMEDKFSEILGVQRSADDKKMRRGPLMWLVGADKDKFDKELEVSQNYRS
uniref:DUF1995 domain-containing protein n=1 Tax=Chromera velia CCMP2878 TaxID=1169474 RepID=A0A0G4HYF0_9ALVE|eukprot:Cvel_9470.t1-p1 / transcript=Cvel_9470.t1 / gene=Cvel_9470 / organism=Chromera_velia_CCMP2878 / gene_product=hypothetical protein / transcript_product=hypothetical protein / location=Cvel_scaffold547:1686-6405(-) / protein_length=385 / sequence_SO=supercontig / SO=protein_coding / is_pseudo=false